MSTRLPDPHHPRPPRAVREAVVSRCRVCDRALHGGPPVCYCCRLSARQLGLPLVPTVVTTEYRVGDRTHARLRGYKDGWTAEERLRHRRALTADLADWLAVHRGSVSARLGPWTVVVPVPSTRRPGRAPCSVLVDGVPELAGRQHDVLEWGSCLPGHLEARREGFALRAGDDRAGLRRSSVLVFDDSVTTGARSQSAAAALRLAGYRVVGVLAVGRALPAGPTGCPATAESGVAAAVSRR